MGRAEQKFPAPRRLALVAAAAAGLALAVAGCSAGQVTQTDTQVAAVNGASGEAGAIAVRDAQLRFPVAEGHYRAGDDAPVLVVIANNGTDADKLISVTSDTSGAAEVSGDAELEPGTAISAAAEQGEADGHAATTTPKSGSSSAPSTATTTASPASGATTTTPTSPIGGVSSVFPSRSDRPSSSADTSVEPGKVRIVLKDLAKELRPGRTLKVTFLFEKAGPVTLDVPIGATPEPRHDAPSEH
ncbi:hypothetical protein [Saccharothrix australiensis]|uniref:Copper(I)-binding protein n=1 Tax=Saccharothrix australiensis TaxID=2072 RepID=A0A495VX69_9PSEU|nr:hypothetical protein [Saccharothrix australiensis]RKT52218.1 hypothetical protein C8E97_0723 [Saccharothrix australiensis]